MANCNKCGEEISFKQVNGKWIPVNPANNENHTCKQKEFKQADQIGDYMKLTADLLKGSIADVTAILSADEEFNKLTPFEKYDIITRNAATLFIHRSKYVKKE